MSANIPGAPRTSDPVPKGASHFGESRHGGSRHGESALRSSRVRVTTAAEASARDHAAIHSGTPSFALMLQAGTQAAAELLRACADCMQDGVSIFAGVGNNGGDAYIVAAQLARAGVRVRLHSAGAPRTADAQRAAALAAPALVHGAPTGHERVIVDGVLGTGHHGGLRDDARRLCAQIDFARERGATIAALDLPSGLDATTGLVAEGSAAARLTLTFGTIKRGLLIARGHVGRIVLLDIGLGPSAQRDDDAWVMADDAAIARLLPEARWDAHKGRRGQLALVGGSVGMAGALVLATRAALAAGCGLVRGWIDRPGVTVLQQSAPLAITNAWPSDGDEAAVAPWGSALAIGPGLGRDQRSHTLLRRALHENRNVPLLLDADALTLLAHEAYTLGIDAAARLREWCADAPHVVITPHPGEFSRLLGAPVPSEWQAKVDVLRDFARRAQATVLLKGTPTIIASPDDAPPIVVARGTAMLATGGSGDILSGLIGALLAQGLGAVEAAVLGATAHGVAAEIATRSAGTIRGLTLEHLLAVLPDTWRAMERPAMLQPGVLTELPTPWVLA